MARLIRDPEVRPKRIGDGVALFIPATEAVHRLNPTAQLLFECLQEPLAEEELVNLFIELTDGQREEIAADLKRMLATFCELGIAVPA